MRRRAQRSTQCDGVVTASATDNYKKWDVVNGPLQMPNAATGSGLATGMINHISVVNPPANAAFPNETHRVIISTPNVAFIAFEYFVPR